MNEGWVMQQVADFLGEEHRCGLGESILNLSVEHRQTKPFLQQVLVLTCWRAVVAYRCAGAASVLIGGLRGEAQGAASSSHIVHVFVGFIQCSRGEAGGDTRMGGCGPRPIAGCMHLITPLTQWHDLENQNNFSVNVKYIENMNIKSLKNGSVMAQRYQNTLELQKLHV